MLILTKIENKRKVYSLHCSLIDSSLGSKLLFMMDYVINIKDLYYYIFMLTDIGIL